MNEALLGFSLINRYNLSAFLLSIKVPALFIGFFFFLKKFQGDVTSPFLIL